MTVKFFVKNKKCIKRAIKVGSVDGHLSTRASTVFISITNVVEIQRCEVEPLKGEDVQLRPSVHIIGCTPTITSYALCPTPCNVITQIIVIVGVYRLCSPQLDTFLLVFEREGR